MRDKRKPLIAPDRKQRLRTIEQRYGKDHYSTIGVKSSTYKDKTIATKASWKYWHPERFSEGELLPEWQELIDRRNDENND